MRLSTSLMYRTSLHEILTQEAALSQLQQQVSGGRQVLTPADDPLAAAQAIKLSQAEDMNIAYASNRAIAKNALHLEDDVLSGVSTLLQGVLTQVIEAGNGIYANADRAALATVVKTARDDLLNKANAMDSNGRYLFSGYLSGTRPYQLVAGGSNYLGDDGQRIVQVDQNQQMASGNPGREIFNRASPSAVNEYVIEQNLANTGTGVYGRVSVVPGGADVGSNFLLTFQDNGGHREYVVTVNGMPRPPVRYTDGLTINIGGVSFKMSGMPAVGDTFTISTVQTVNMDLFATMEQLIAALEAPADGDQVAQSKLDNALATSNRKLNLALDNVLLVQASVGARGKDLEELDSAGSHRALDYAQQRPDMVKTMTSLIEELELRKVVFQAAVDSFRSLQGLSLFSRR